MPDKLGFEDLALLFSSFMVMDKFISSIASSIY